MRRSDVPLEDFEIQFSGEKLNDAIKAKEILVTILRFIDNEIRPKVEKFIEHTPNEEEMRNHPIRTCEDGRYFLHIQGSIREFKHGQYDHLARYLGRAIQELYENDDDGKYVEDLALHTLDKLLEPLERIARVANNKFDNFVEMEKGQRQSPEEENEIVKSVEQAGYDCRKPLHKIFCD